jgi:DNA-binding FrmR family transcriptional regulator
MSGGDDETEKMTDSEKLDRILGQLATMNHRLDTHAQCITLLEQEPPTQTGSPRG